MNSVTSVLNLSDACSLAMQRPDALYHLKPPSCLARFAVSNLTTLRVIGMAVGSFLYFVFYSLVEKVREFCAWVFCYKFKGTNNLLLAGRVIPSFNREWYQNFSLMRDVHDRTNNPEIKQLTKFLAANYLGSAAPVDLSVLRMIGSCCGIEQLHNTPGYGAQYAYHRYAFLDNSKIAKECNNNLVLSHQSPLIPIDTKEISDLFDLSFTVLNQDNQNRWVSILVERLDKHFVAHGFDDPLQLDFLLDASQFLEPYMNRECSEVFERNYQIVKDQLNEAIRAALLYFPELNRSKLKKFIKKNITGIVSLDVEQFAGLKVLPLFDNSEANKYLTRHPSFKNFLMNTGTFIGAVNARRYLVDVLPDYSDVRLREGGVPRHEVEVRPVSETDLFERLRSVFQTTDNDAVKNLGFATLKLIEGLESRVSYATVDPSKRELLAQIILQMVGHLNGVEQTSDQRFANFSEAIKLVHYDLMGILEITRPYRASDFEQIYVSNLSEMGDHTIRAGLTKTGMNAFAGINKAVMGDQCSENLVRVHGKGLYFENSGFLGDDHTLQQALNDPNIRKVDLFACQFSSNIDVSADCTHYEVGHIAEDIHRIFSEKPETDNLTVAVDCTIDYINSPKMQRLIAEFREEIDAGRINFVFFRSGQKLDMFGMDNYYGAPYVIVNNGHEKWQGFDFLSESKALETDPLSLQWFCLANEFTYEELEEYRRLIFQNTREILFDLPPYLNDPNARIRINTIDSEMDACFIDVKLSGWLHRARAGLIMGDLYRHCLSRGMSLTARASFGFNQANVNIISIVQAAGSSSIRITPGIDPRENAIIKEFLYDLAYHL